MKHNFCDLVDIPNLQNLMQSFYQTTGIPIGIIDADGNILVAVGWQKICKDFHRKNLHTEALCRQSNSYVKQHLVDSKPYIYYKCENGLIDAAAPIVIDGQHVATIFHGQFLFEKPDKDFFESQADRYGFNKEEYLAALADVPIYTQEKLDAIMHFFSFLSKMLAELGSRLKKIDQQTQKLQQSDEQIFMIFNSTPNIAIQAYDEFGNITFWNIASEQLYGLKQTEVIGRSLNNKLFDNEWTERLLKALEEMMFTNSLYGPAEWKIKHVNGQEKCVYFTLFPIRLSTGSKSFICMNIDISEQKQLEQELARLDRLNIIGEMAAGIGHEVRNPMTTVRGYLQIFQRKEEFSKYSDQLCTMIEELDRANDIITEFLALARNKTIKMQYSNLNDVIHAIFPLLQADALRMGHEILLETGDIPYSYFDDKEIRQLIINLVRNGLEAMVQSGVVTIRTYIDNNEIILAVQDTGSGIPRSVLEKIGNPFVTTKENGTGLGLPVCYRIADRHKARIEIDTGATGTTFFIKFSHMNTVSECDF